MSEEKLHDFIVINGGIFIGAMFDKARRHPKIILIFVLLAYASVCVCMLKFGNGNRPFFSLSAILSLIVALPMIIFYKKPEHKPRQRRERPDLLSTDPSWFDEHE